MLPIQPFQLYQKMLSICPETKFSPNAQILMLHTPNSPLQILMLHTPNSPLQILMLHTPNSPLQITLPSTHPSALILLTSYFDQKDERAMSGKL